MVAHHGDAASGVDKVADRYLASLRGFQTHLRQCQVCDLGLPCPDGEDAAQREHRDWHSLRQAEAEAAHRHRRPRW